MTNGLAPPRASILVAGGGPAGLASAIALAQAGFGVELYDPRLREHDKACGEGLMPSGVAALAALGVVLPTGASVPVLGVAFNEGARRAEGRFVGHAGGAIGLSRHRLVAALSDRAAALGVVCRAGRVSDLRSGPTGVAYIAGGERRQAAWAVVADGLHSGLRRALLPNATARRRRRRWGHRQHFACRPWSALIEVYLAAGSEAYVTPVGEGEINVAVLTGERGATFGTLLAQFPALLARLAKATPLDRPRGAGPLWQDSAHCFVGRIALVGDAAGYVDAITGEGVSLALASALLLAATLREGGPLSLYARRRRPLARHTALHVRLLLLLARWPLVRRLVLTVLGRLPRLFAWWLERSTHIAWQRALTQGL